MKRFFLIVCINFAVLPLFAEDFFWKNFSDITRYDLALAYDEVGRHYETLNETEKSQAFLMMAEQIYPNFKTAVSPPREPSSPEAASSPASDSSPPAAVKVPAAPRYYWEKFLQGVLNENTVIIESILAERFYIPLREEGFTKAEIRRELAWLFDTYDLSQLTIEDIYLTDTIEITPLKNGYWLLSVEIDEELMDLFPSISFWRKRQGFYFKKFSQGWRLSAVGIN